MTNFRYNFTFLVFFLLMLSVASLGQVSDRTMLHYVGVPDIEYGDSLIVKPKATNTSSLPKVVDHVVIVRNTDGMELARMTGEKRAMFGGDIVSFRSACLLDSVHQWSGEYNDLYVIESQIYEKGRLLDKQVAYAGLRAGNTIPVMLESDVHLPGAAEPSLPIFNTEESATDESHIVRAFLYYPDIVSHIYLKLANTQGVGLRFEVWGTTTQTLMGRIYSQKTLLTQGFTDKQDGLFGIAIPQSINGESTRVRAKIYEVCLYKDGQEHVPAIEAIYLTR